MKRFFLTAAFLSVPCGLVAQTDAQMIENALTAAPARAREAATVIKWKADNTYEVLQEGTNTWLCYDRSGEEGRAPFAVQCTSMANLDRLVQNRKFAAQAADREAMNALLAAAEADGTRAMPEYGSPWIAMNGPDRASASVHITIAVPGASVASTGLPDTRGAGGAWLMGAGTSTAHIMIPAP